MALTAKFSGDNAKQRQWRAFQRKGRLPVIELPTTIALLYALLWPATIVAASQSAATAAWNPQRQQWR